MTFGSFLNLPAYLADHLWNFVWNLMVQSFLIFRYRYRERFRETVYNCNSNAIKSFWRSSCSCIILIFIFREFYLGFKMMIMKCLTYVYDMITRIQFYLFYLADLIFELRYSPCRNNKKPLLELVRSARIIYWPEVLVTQLVYFTWTTASLFDFPFLHNVYSVKLW